MKTFPAILLLCALCCCPALRLQAQVNLVPNPSFEIYSSCPDVGAQVYKATGWMNCGETPDYLHACSPITALQVPYNFAGYQPAATGIAYCDICTYSTVALYREFIGIALTQPMVIGHTFFVSFKCSPGSPGFGYCLQTNKLGIRFSTVSYDSAHSAPIDNFAHVYTDTVVGDTANWTSVSGYVTADSAYTFLTIGNFFDDANTDTIIPGFQCAAFAIYYIDDVAVTDTLTGIGTVHVPDNKITYYQYGNDLVFRSDKNPIAGITLFDYTGRQITTKSHIRSNDIKLNISGLSSGIYMALVQSGKQTQKIKCFILKN